MGIEDPVADESDGVLRRETCPPALLLPVEAPLGKQVLVLDATEGDGDSGGPLLLHNVEVHGPMSPKVYPVSGLEEVIDDQLADILMEEFGGDLENFRRTQRQYKMKVSLLVEHHAVGEDGPPLELLGFLAYKTWGAPAPGVSVGAIGIPTKHRGQGYGRQLMRVAEEQAVKAAMAAGTGLLGEVRLRSLATATGFYKQLGFELLEAGPDDEPSRRTPCCPDPEAAPDAPKSKVEEDDDDAPAVPMVLRCAPFTPQTAAKAVPLSPMQDPWTPIRSRALEDGPTWPPVNMFMMSGEEGRARLASIGSIPEEWDLDAS